MRLVDTHCHLDHRKFSTDRDAVIERARAAGVERMVAIGTGEGPPDLEAGVRLAQEFACFSATVGVHPHDASKATPSTMEHLRELCRHPKVVALGEIGLDYHYDFSPREAQVEVFRAQVRIAREAGLPVVIHTREAWADTVRILREEDASAGIFHCFTEGPWQAEEALELGFHLAFGGVVTFPRSDALREAARLTPAGRVLLETDAPYLAPAPYRGQRNEPAFLVETLRRLAEVRGDDPETLAAVAATNFEQLCLR